MLMLLAWGVYGVLSCLIRKPWGVKREEEGGRRTHRGEIMERTQKEQSDGTKNPHSLLYFATSDLAVQRG